MGHICTESCSSLEPNIVGIILAILFVIFIVIVLFYMLGISGSCVRRGINDGRVFLCSLFAIVLIIYIMIIVWVSILI